MSEEMRQEMNETGLAVAQETEVAVESNQVEDSYLEDDEFRLPVGYIDNEGRLHCTVKLKPMTGETEEAIASPKLRDNGGKMITELISQIVVRLGAMKNVPKDVIRQLSIVDRDFILLKNRQVSIGDTVNYQDNCPHCRGKNDIYLDLNTVEVQYLTKEGKRELTFELNTGVLNKKGQYCKKITILMPNGFVQERVAPLARINPAQASTTMLQSITKKIEGVEFISADTFRKMTKKDRDLILSKSKEFEAKVELAVNVVCAECGSEFTTAIPLASLLGE